MPNFHPELVAAVAPLLAADEEVWAVYPSTRRSLVVTGSRMFVVGRDDPEEHALDEFVSMQRPRERLVMLERRAGIAIALHIDPLDEHGLQALTVIGLLLAIGAKSDRLPVSGAPPASAPPVTLGVPPIRRRHVLRAGRAARRRRRQAIHRGFRGTHPVTRHAEACTLTAGAC